jgi:rhodanese-related sulfurtransferase
MTPQQVQQQLASQPETVLLHVLPPEVFAAQHIAGSKNACIYETAFLDQVTALLPDKQTPVIVYGAGEGSQDAAVATERLTEAGYTSVTSFHGGISAWAAAGLPLAGTGPLAPVLPHGHYVIDATASLIRWTGRNLFNHHHGSVAIQGGELNLTHGQCSSGSIQADLTRITCDDLADPTWNSMLLQHLAHTDFFATAAHPTATFAITSIAPVPHSTPGTPSHRIIGQITIRGISQPLDFPAVIAASEDATRITAQAQIEIDRTLFGSIYGSGRFFRFLGKHVVNDHFQLHLKIHADRQA